MRRGQTFVQCRECDCGFPGPIVPPHRFNRQPCPGGPELYKGWTITDNGAGVHPITGRFRAVRFGVSMCHPTREGIGRMIDTKAEEERTP